MTNEKLGKRLYSKLLEIYPKGITLTALRESMIGSSYFHCSRKRMFTVLIEWEKLKVVRVTEMKRRPNEYMIRFDPEWLLDRRPLSVRQLQERKLLEIKRRLQR